MRWLFFILYDVNAKHTHPFKEKKDVPSSGRKLSSGLPTNRMTTKKVSNKGCDVPEQENYIRTRGR